MNEPKVLFCNNKSIEMFGVNLTDEDGIDGAFWSGTKSKQSELMTNPRFVACSPSIHDQETEKNGEEKQGEDTLISLQEVLMSKAAKDLDQPEYYTMTYTDLENDKQVVVNKTIIVKKIDFIFNDQSCKVINFTDISTYNRLQKQEEINRLLRALNMSVHHEMLAPLKANMEISMRLYNRLKQEDLKQMAQIINISSNMLILHAQDLLDQRIIEQGKFAPCYSKSKVSDAINEIVNMVNLTLDQTQLNIVHNKVRFDEIRFDVRRLQQVLLNILSNSIKYQRVGEITVSSDVQIQEDTKAVINV